MPTLLQNLAVRWIVPPGARSAAVQGAKPQRKSPVKVRRDPPPRITIKPVRRSAPQERAPDTAPPRFHRDAHLQYQPHSHPPQHDAEPPRSAFHSDYPHYHAPTYTPPLPLHHAQDNYCNSYEHAPTQQAQTYQYQPHSHDQQYQQYQHDQQHQHDLFNHHQEQQTPAHLPYDPYVHNGADHMRSNWNSRPVTPTDASRFTDTLHHTGSTGGYIVNHCHIVERPLVLDAPPNTSVISVGTDDMVDDCLYTTMMRQIGCTYDQFWNSRLIHHLLPQYTNMRVKGVHGGASHEDEDYENLFAQLYNKDQTAFAYAMWGCSTLQSDCIAQILAQAQAVYQGSANLSVLGCIYSWGPSHLDAGGCHACNVETTSRGTHFVEHQRQRIGGLVCDAAAYRSVHYPDPDLRDQTFRLFWFWNPALARQAILRA